MDFLCLSNGAQLAMNTTLVSYFTSAGEPRRHRRSTARVELVCTHGCRLVVLAIELAFARSLLHSVMPASLLTCSAGRPCLPSQLRGPLQQAFCPCRWGGAANVDGDAALLTELLVDSAESPLLASRMPYVVPWTRALHWDRGGGLKNVVEGEKYQDATAIIPSSVFHPFQ